MSEFPAHPVPESFGDAHVSAESYRAMYQRSIEDPAGFFGEMGGEGVGPHEKEKSSPGRKDFFRDQLTPYMLLDGYRDSAVHGKG